MGLSRMFIDHRRTLLVLLFSLSELFLGRALADDLEVVVAGQAAALKSVQTLSAHVVVDSVPGNEDFPVSADYWRSFDRIRIKEYFRTGQREDILVKDSKVLSVGRAGKDSTSKYPIAGTKTSVQDALCICDIWMRMILNFPGRKTGRLPLDEFLRQTHKQLTCRKVQDQGKQTVYVRVVYEDPDYGEKEIEVWFDPAVNYLATKMFVTWQRSEEKNQARTEILKFSEASPGVYFPVKSQTQAFYGKKLLATTHTALSDLHINEPLAEGIFQLEIPAGTMMADRIQGKLYKTDSHGLPVGEVKELPMNAPPPLDVAANTLFSSQTTEEPRSIYKWIVVASMFVLVLATVLWLLHRRRKAS